MKLWTRLALVGLLLGISTSACAQAVTFRAADGLNNVPVSAANPLPTTATITGGGDASAANQVTGNASLAIIAAAVVGTGPTTTGNLSATLAMTTATTTKIITGVAAKLTYLTALDTTSSAAADVSIVYGTGSNCGTGTTTLALYHLVAGGGIAKGAGVGNLLAGVAASTDVCVTVSATSNVSTNMTYVQQ